MNRRAHTSTLATAAALLAAVTLAAPAVAHAGTLPTAAVATAAGRDRTAVCLTAPTRPRSGTYGLALVDVTRSDTPMAGTVLVTVTPAGGRAYRPAAHRLGRNGRGTFGLPARFAGRIVVRYSGDRTHRPSTATLTVAAPPGPPVFVLPSSYTFGKVLSCRRTADGTDFDATYTVVAHGGRYTDLGNYYGLTDTPVDGGERAFTMQTDDGTATIGGDGQLPPGPQPFTFTPTYDETLAPLTGDLYTKSGETRAASGSFPDVTVTCI